MQSRDYLQKQYEQLGKVLASTVANLLKIKYNTLETKQEAINNLDDSLKELINSEDELFKSKIEKYPQDLLQNLSLLIKELQNNNSDYKNLDKKLKVISSMLANKHRSIDFNNYF